MVGTNDEEGERRPARTSDGNGEGDGPPDRDPLSPAASARTGQADASNWTLHIQLAAGAALDPPSRPYRTPAADPVGPGDLVSVDVVDDGTGRPAPATTDLQPGSGVGSRVVIADDAGGVGPVIAGGATWLQAAAAGFPAVDRLRVHPERRAPAAAVVLAGGVVPAVQPPAAAGLSQDPPRRTAVAGAAVPAGRKVPAGTAGADGRLATIALATGQEGRQRPRHAPAPTAGQAVAPPDPRHAPVIAHLVQPAGPPGGAASDRWPPRDVPVLKTGVTPVGGPPDQPSSLLAAIGDFASGFDDEAHLWKRGIAAVGQPIGRTVWRTVTWNPDQHRAINRALSAFTASLVDAATFAWRLLPSWDLDLHRAVNARLTEVSEQLTARLVEATGQLAGNPLLYIHWLTDALLGPTWRAPFRAYLAQGRPAAMLGRVVGMFAFLLTGGYLGGAYVHSLRGLIAREYLSQEYLIARDYLHDLRGLVREQVPWEHLDDLRSRVRERVPWGRTRPEPAHLELEVYGQDVNPMLYQPMSPTHAELLRQQLRFGVSRTGSVPLDPPPRGFRPDGTTALTPGAAARDPLPARMPGVPADLLDRPLVAPIEGGMFSGNSEVQAAAVEMALQTLGEPPYMFIQEVAGRLNNTPGTVRGLNVDLGRRGINTDHGRQMRTLELYLQSQDIEVQHIGPSFPEPPPTLIDPVRRGPAFELTDDALGRLTAGEPVDPYDYRPDALKRRLTIADLEEATRGGRPAVVHIKVWMDLSRPPPFPDLLSTLSASIGDEFVVVDRIFTAPRTFWQWLARVPPQRVVAIRAPGFPSGPVQYIQLLESFERQYTGRGLVFR